MQMTHNVSRASEYRALVWMYVAQGLPAGFAFFAMPALIRQSGHGMAEIGLVGLAFLPWAFKFLWASFMDNACTRFGHGKVIFVTHVLCIITAVLLLLVSPQTQLMSVVVGVIVLNTLSSTQDIVTNSYAVIRMQGKAAGVANAIQIVGIIIGMLLGGGGVLVVFDLVGWQGAIGFIAGLFVLTGFLLAIDRRWCQLVSDNRQTPQAKVRLRDLLLHKDLKWALAIALIFKFSSTAVSTLMQPWLVDQGIDLASIGHLQMAMLLATAIGGATLGIVIVRTFGNRRAVVVSTVLAVIVLGLPWLLETLHSRDVRLYYLAFCVQGLFEGAMYVAIWALFMNWASARRPGTDYTAVQCCESLANAVASGMIGGLSQHIGYGATFAWIWFAAALVFIAIVWCLPRLVLHNDAQAGGHGN